MHGLDLLQDLAVVMIVAGVVTIVFHRLRQPVVLGYIIAGAIVGPHTPPILLIHDEHTIKNLAEIGVIFLMFSLGLHFSLRKLASVGATAFIGATLEILLMFLIGYGIGCAFGWGTVDSIFLGAILSISSTTIIVKALTELGLVKEKFAQLIFGILIVEDILAIAMLALLPSVAQTGSLPVGEVMVTLGRLGIFLAVVLVFGLLAVPVVLRYIARFKSDEMLLIAALGLCFGVSLLAVKLGYSVALGAFLIGAIVAEAREAGKIETLIGPVRDLFSAVFFVTIGMLIDPRLIVEHWVAILVITAAVVVGKVIACAVGAFIAGHDIRTALRVGMGLAQIGEFSFIIAQLGLDLKNPHDKSQSITSDFIYPIAVAVSAITTLLTPYLIKSSDPLVGWFSRTAPKGLVSYLQVYSDWVEKLGADGRGSGHEVRRLVRKWGLQIGLNIALVSGLLIAAAWAGRHFDDMLPKLPRWTGGSKTLVWLAGIFLSLPLLVASFRKLRAAATVIAEVQVSRAAAKEHTAAIRAVVANTMLAAGSVMIVFWVLLLSSAMLPPLPVFVVLLVIIAAVVALMWKHFIRVYAKAQIALKETLTAPPAPHHDAEAPVAISPILRDAALDTIALPKDWKPGAKLIRELALRTATGASVVGVERDGTNLINPGPDEELRGGDNVLLIGTTDHLAAARKLLLGS